MSITVSNVTSNQYFGTLLTRQNQIGTIISQNVVTTDSSANGSLTTGNGYVNGALGVLTLSANSLAGGNVSGAANLNIITNTSFYSNTITNILQVAGNSTTTFININSSTINLNNSTKFVGNVVIANSANIASNLTVNNVNIVNSLNVGTTITTTNLTAAFSNISGNVIIGGSLTVSGNLIATAVSQATANLVPATDDIYNLGNTINRWLNGYIVNFVGNTINLGNSTVNLSINSTFYTGQSNTALTANNSTNFGGLPSSSFANTTSPLFSTSITVGNSSVNVSINSTAFTGTVNNATYLNGVIGSSYQLNSTLASNVAGMTANNSTNFAGQGQSYYANVTSPLFTTTVSVGNSTVNAVINSTSLKIGSATVNSSYFTGQSNTSLTANNTTYLNGQLSSYYANATSYPGAFNGTTIVTSGAATFAGIANAQNGVQATGIDDGGSGGQIRIVVGGGNYGFIQRLDASNYYHMLTASGNQYGTWNTLRPYTVALSTGYVTIDGTGAGTTFGGNITVSGGTVTATTFTGTANNANYLGGTAASSLSVNFANSSTYATHNFISGSGTWGVWNWAGQAGQPSWLWGGNDGTNMYVYNPSNFNVNNATYLQGYVPSNFIQQANVSLNAGFTNGNYTLTTSDSGRIVYGSNGTVFVPSGLPSGFRCMVLSTGNPVTIANNAGVSLVSRTGNYSILQSWGSATILVIGTTIIVDGNI